MRHFSPLQLKEYLSSLSNNDDQPLLLDVREQWEFDYCNIEGSVLIPMGELAAELDSFTDEYDYDREIIMICHHGIRSRQMGYYMEQTGYKNIINLDGGVEQWAEDVDKTMKRY
jgi:rhodanese-related sulfurtransferase